MRFADLSVRSKLLIAILVMIAALVAVSTFGLTAITKTNKDVHQLYGERTLPIYWLGQIYGSQAQAMQSVDRAMYLGTENALREAEHALQKHRQTIEGNLEHWRGVVRNQKDRDSLRGVIKAREQLIVANDELMASLRSGRSDAAREIRETKSQAAFDELRVAITSALDAELAGARALQEHSQEIYESDLTLTIILTSVSTAISLLLALYIVRTIMQSLRRAVSVAEAISQGRLGNTVVVESKDELGSLLESLGRMDAKLHEIVAGVHQSAGNVGSAAQQLSQGNDDLSQRTQEQASALEETAASMEEMTSTVKQNADNARQAHRLAAGAREQAAEGGNVVANATEAMSEISGASHKIEAIIGVIDEIAFQTNLLALNAAVEAARAGEQGRGFAVVAAEVRNLAQRSATAAKEIKALIADSVEKVDAGCAFVNASGQALTQIIQSVNQVSEVLAEIAAATSEQSTGIDQVNTAVAQIDEFTQQNAALVEEAAAAAKSMQHETQRLIERVSFFQSAEKNGAVTRMPSPSTHVGATVPLQARSLAA